MGHETEAWAAAQLGQKLENSNPEDLKAIREAGILPEDVAEILAVVENKYNPGFGKNIDGVDPSEYPSLAHNCEKYRQIITRWTSKILSKAVHNGHDRIINRFLTVVEQDTDISGIQVMIRFTNWVCREAGITYLAGHMGSGKTDFALLMAEVFYEQMHDTERGANVACNIESAGANNEYIEFIDNQPDLEKWLEQPGYSFFVFDEASSHASGYSGDAAQVTKQFRSMVRLIRKSDGSMVIIGHDGKDLHPTIRELADYVSKESKKQAAVFQSVQDREGEDLKFNISDIPATTLFYDTKEASMWNWAEENGTDLEEIMARTYTKTNLTQKETSEIFEVSQSKVSEAASKYQDPPR